MMFSQISSKITRTAKLFIYPPNQTDSVIVNKNVLAVEGFGPSLVKTGA